MGKTTQKNKKKLDENSVKNLLRPLSNEQIDSLSAKELRILLKGEQQLRSIFEEAYYEAQAMKKELEDKVLCIEGQIVKLKNRLFNPKSERMPPPPNPEKSPEENEKNLSGKKRPLTKPRDLQERYPDAEVIETEIRLEELPACPCCQGQMNEMGVFEQSQTLTVIPKKYLITNILRMKYHCSHCHGAIQTAPTLPRIIPRSNYGDEFLIDVTTSKYCDLLPIERYCAMAARGGFNGLPPNTLHESVWRFAMFLRAVYELIRIETLDSRILHGDETTHKMLEGHERDRWYLWGFFGMVSCFFECHPARAGAIAGDVLSESGCEYFMSDAYEGYSSAIKDVNKLRELAELAPIVEILCNAHARRYFDECGDNPDSKKFMMWYQKIYQLEKEVKILLPRNVDEARAKRQEMFSIFDAMEAQAKNDLTCYPSGHSHYQASQYFLNHFSKLTASIPDPYVPLDNNLAERGLRSHVIGRKTWYGTHSERGAEAASIHFTIVESCKMCKVNPREYYREIVNAIHFKRPLFTPSQFKAKLLGTEPESTKIEKQLAVV